VLVDTQNVLNFSATKLITGINILDDYLFFTDDNSEPKKVNIKKGVFTSANFTTHSQYEGRNFIESDITVIKKSPLNAPGMVLNSDIRGGQNINSAIIQNFSNAQANDSVLKDAYAVGTEISNVNLSPAANYQIGDVLVLTGDETNDDELGEYYTVKVEVTSRVNAPTELTNQIDIKILSITSQVIDKNDDTWEVELLQDDPIFKLQFPRFGYRWKYNDNQFSCFSPFTEVAFLPSGFEFNAKKGYNEGMSNSVRKITLNSFDATPDDVIEIEILYKQTNNAAIYVVDNIVLEEEPNFSEFEITSELIYKIVQSNQILRPWDNVPRLAKSQELVGNRLVYGNYLQNYNIDGSVKFNQCGLSSNGTAGPESPKASIKSLRTYQVGIVFKDKYGRETPVFTDNTGIIKTNLQDAITPTQIHVKAGAAAADINTIAPWATHFKFFIKEPSQEYYNLAADRIFLSKDGVTCWISLPSSERNKITEDSYLILKKGHDADVPVIADDNKYKVLDISNEAPAELTEKRVILYTASIRFDQSFGSGIPIPAGTDRDTRIGQLPYPGSKSFTIAYEGGSTGVTDQAQLFLKAGNYIKFSGSNLYEIASVVYDTSGADEAKVFLVDAFNTDIDGLYTVDSSDEETLTLTALDNTLDIYGNVDIAKDALFQGKFFIKLEKNETLKDACFAATDLVAETSITMFGSVSNNGQTLPGAGYYGNAVNVRIWGGGVPNVIYNNSNPWNIDGLRDGGYKARSNNEPPFADGPGDTRYELVIEKRNSNRFDRKFIDAISTPGTKLRFSNASPADDTVYEIDYTNIQTRGDRVRYYIKFTEQLASIVNPNKIAYNTWVADGSPNAYRYHQVSISVLGIDENADFETANPAIFETEPQEPVDLNIYYEASNAIPVAQYANTHTLNYHNVFTFGNGVESNRIRDDFNAAFIDKGTKASAVLEDPYGEERRATGLIYSGIYNSISGLNSLNQFIQAEKITKDINPIYGSIQKLHTRDTNLVTLCEDKCLRILANKDALFNADGNVNVTSNNNVLGQAVPFAGEFGISKNPESFASYGFRAYFSDKKRGVVLRLSMDGLTEISGKGMSDYFYDNLKAATTVLGSYDIYSDTYNLTLNNDTVCFKESSDGWPTRKSYIPEWGISLNADYYTMSNGMLWTHDNQNRNTFYEGSTAKSSVQLIFNDNPSQIKNFKTLSYEGDNGWTAPLIQTDQQDGQVTTFLDKENIYYNYIRGVDDTWDNAAQTGTLDLKQFAAQGIGNPSSIGTYTGNTTFTVTVKNDPVN
jgi:hypothetical protein